MTRNTSLTSACESSLLNISSWRKPIRVNTVPTELHPIYNGALPVNESTGPVYGAVVPSFVQYCALVDRPTAELGIIAPCDASFTNTDNSFAVGLRYIMKLAECCMPAPQTLDVPIMSISQKTVNLSGNKNAAVDAPIVHTIKL